MVTEIYHSSVERKREIMRLKTRPTDRRKLVKKLDALCSQLVRKKGVCAMKGRYGDCGGVLQCAHIFPRTYYSTRWDFDNLLCLCYRHHIHFAHKNPMLFSTWVLNHLGEPKYELLKMRAHMVLHRTTSDLFGMLHHLEDPEVQKVIVGR